MAMSSIWILTLGKVPYTDPKVQAVFDKWDELVKPGYFLENHAALKLARSS